MSLDTNLSLGSEKVSGVLNVLNPNVQNSDKSLNFGLQANETDRLSTYGYKSKKIGGFIGTGFEYLEDFYLGLRASSFIEDIETDTTASSRQKQAGDYFDTYEDLILITTREIKNLKHQMDLEVFIPLIYQ